MIDLQSPGKPAGKILHKIAEQGSRRADYRPLPPDLGGGFGFFLSPGKAKDCEQSAQPAGCDDRQGGRSADPQAEATGHAGDDKPASAWGLAARGEAAPPGGETENADHAEKCRDAVMVHLPGAKRIIDRK